MISAFGIEHGEISKGLPSAVRAGGGGLVGSFMRMKNSAGRSAGKLLGHPGYSDTHRSSLKYLAESEKKRGQQIKGVTDDLKFDAKHKTAYKSREIRAGLLNADSKARRQGYKTGKSSALDRHYRGRVGPMERLP